MSHSRVDALVQATMTARMLFGGAIKLGRCAVVDLPLMAWLPLLTMGKRDSNLGNGSEIDPISPAILEVLLFGSVARNEECVGDVDLMVLDSGFYSQVVMDKIRRSRRRPNSKDVCLRENLEMLLVGFMGCEVQQTRIPTDVQVFPYTVVTDEVFREEIGQQQQDPRFFDNAFGAMMRYDANSGQFVAITLNELRERLLENENGEVSSQLQGSTS